MSVEKTFTVCHLDDPFSRRWECQYGFTSKDDLDSSARRIRINNDKAIIHTFSFDQDVLLTDQRNKIQKTLARDYLPKIDMVKSKK